jgi:hypothetical protein
MLWVVLFLLVDGVLTLPPCQDACAAPRSAGNFSTPVPCLHGAHPAILVGVLREFIFYSKYTREWGMLRP